MKNMKTPSRQQLRNTAVEAAQAAGKVLLKHFRTKLKIRDKLNAGIVTNADLEAEAAALSVLQRKFPHFGVLTEESGTHEARSPGRWVMDPLDGTTNYAHGFPMFCVSIAAEWEGELQAGVIFHPIFNDLYTAIKGKGAFLGKKKIRVSTAKTLSHALLSTGFTSRKDKGLLENEMRAFKRLSLETGAIRRPGSAALDLAYVARGVFDGFWSTRLSPWDIAAGILLVEEAGGKATGFKGQPFQLDSGQLIASNGRIHPAMVRRTRS